MQIDETKQHKKLGSSDDDDDDALMRVISVCFPNVFSFLWLNHLISLIMTDKKSVVSTPAFPDLNCVWSLVSSPLKTTDEDNTDVRDHDEDSVDVQVTDDQAERDDSEREMGKQSEPTFPLSWTNTGQDTWYHRQIGSSQGSGDL